MVLQESNNCQQRFPHKMSARPRKTVPLSIGENFLFVPSDVGGMLLFGFYW
jgi:hypothetical protein